MFDTGGFVRFPTLRTFESRNSGSRSFVSEHRRATREDAGILALLPRSLGVQNLTQAVFAGTLNVVRCESPILRNPRGVADRIGHL